MNNKYFKRHSAQSGFSLIELLVTIFIIITLSTTLLFNYNTTNSRIALLSQVHEFALLVREAQVYALGARLQGTQPYLTYGVYVAEATPDQVIIFADKFDPTFNTATPDKMYNPRALPCGDPNSECVKVITFSGRNLISEMATDSGGNMDNGQIHIVFTRPQPDAHILDKNGTEYNQVDVQLSSPRNDTRTLSVMSSGQISVQ